MPQKMTPDEAIVALWGETNKFHSRVHLYDAIVAGTAPSSIMDRYGQLTRAVVVIPPKRDEQPPGTGHGALIPKQTLVNLCNRTVGTADRSRLKRQMQFTTP